MANNILAGSTLGFSAGTPATDDEAGFEALTFTTIPADRIMDFSGFDDSWQTKTDDSYSTAAAKSKKIRKQFGDVSITLKYDKTDTALYGIVDTAYDSQTDLIAVCFTASNGNDTQYFQALVTVANWKGGASGDDETYAITLAPQTEPVLGTEA